MIPAERAPRGANGDGMETAADPRALLSRSVKLTLFVMLRRTLDRTVLRENLGAHLRWMVDAEKRGQVFLSGPVAPRDGAAQLDGLTVIRAANLAEAEALAATDPFVKLGAIEYDIREWTANEGAISMTVTLSDSTVAFR
jgi:uncharacterized protein YciI